MTIFPQARARLARRILAGATLCALAASIGDELAASGDHILRTAASRLRDWHTLETSLRVPKAGLDILPPQIVATLSMLDQNNIETFRLSRGILADDYLSQRVAEGAWPRRVDATSPFLVSRAAENTGCLRLAAAEGVALDRCD